MFYLSSKIVYYNSNENILRKNVRDMDVNLSSQFSRWRGNERNSGKGGGKSDSGETCNSIGTVGKCQEMFSQTHLQGEKGNVIMK